MLRLLKKWESWRRSAGDTRIICKLLKKENYKEKGIMMEIRNYWDPASETAIIGKGV